MTSREKGGEKRGEDVNSRDSPGNLVLPAERRVERRGKLTWEPSLTSREKGEEKREEAVKSRDSPGNLVLPAERRVDRTVGTHLTS